MANWKSLGARRLGRENRRPSLEHLEPRHLLTAAAADFVIHISVDGLRPDAITSLGATELPNFHRLRNQGAFTDNARTDHDYTITLPNHSTQVTGRPVVGDIGHNWTSNSDPAAGQTLHSNKGSYVASAWDVAHDHALSTGLFASKTKFSLFDNSYDADTSDLQGGAPDSTGADNGPDKIDTYLYSSDTAKLTDDFVSAMSASPFQYVMVHYHDPDTAGHNSGWMGDTYLNAVRHVDAQLGKIMSMIDSSGTTLAGRTSVILTSDHGGSNNSHSDPSDPLNYTIPFYVWGPGATAGADLYSLNTATRTDPGTGRLGNEARPQPIRDGDAAGLALDLLGLPPVVGSLFNANHDLIIGPAGLPAGSSASLAGPQDNGSTDLDPAPGSVHVTTVQSSLRIRLVDADDINDATVAPETLRMTRDGFAVADYNFAYDATADTITLTPTSEASFSYGRYEIFLNDTAAEVKDSLANPLDATRLQLYIDGSTAQLTTVSFQQGVADYSGTYDTQIQSYNATTDYGSSPEITVDSDEPPGTGHDSQGLVRFDSIFGTASGQIPVGSEIRSARLELSVFNPGSAVNVHRMLSSWSESDTWNSLINGVQADGIEATSTVDTSFTASATGTHALDVTNALQAWSAAPSANYGWVLLPTGTDGVDFYSSEGNSAPRLVVEFVAGTPPIANGDSYDTNEDTTLTVAAPGVLANDSDAEGQPLSAVLASGPLNGTLTLNPDGSFVYTPEPNFEGTDSFTYRASDGSTTSSTATVTITVNPTPDAPVAVDDAYQAMEGRTLLIAAPGVLSNDFDPDALSDPDHAAPLNAVLETSPQFGSLALNLDGSLSYTPPTGFTGTDWFTYWASDGELTSDRATVTINVARLNTAPVATDGTLGTSEDTPANGTLTANDSDEDPLTYLLVSQGALGTVTITDPSTGAYTYTPNANASGSDSFAFKVSDGEAESNAATVTVTIAPVNDEPVAGDDAYSAWQDTTLSVSAANGVLSNDEDIEGDSLSAVLVSGPSNGLLSLNADGSFTYQPNSGFVGNDEFSYQAFDAADWSAPAIVALTVQSSTVEHYAVTETTVTGTRNGALTDTYSANDIYEQITEVSSVGRPSLRYGLLEHRWTFELSSDTATSFEVEGHAADTSETFAFEYSTDGGSTWNSMLVLSATTDAGSSYAFPSGVTGTLHVRVVDQTRVAPITQGAILIDHMVVHARTSTAPALPEVTIIATDPAAAEAGSDPGVFAISRTGNTDSDLVVNFEVSGTAAEGADYQLLPRSLTISAGSSTATITVVPVDDSEAESSETVVLTLAAGSGYVAGASSSGSVSIADNEATPTTFYAASETSVSGTVSGSLADTQASDNQYQQITEVQSGGRPNTRYSFLEHLWSFDLAGGSATGFHLEARTNNLAESFVFAYSTDGGNSWTQMVTVSSDSDTAYQYNFALAVTGTVLVRVVDATRAPGSTTQASVFVDHMYLSGMSGSAITSTSSTSSDLTSSTISSSSDESLADDQAAYAMAVDQVMADL